MNFEFLNYVFDQNRSFLYSTKLTSNLEPPGNRPDRNPCQLKHQHWVKRPNQNWEDYFVRVWKRENGGLVSEMVPLHVSEYFKPSALWIFHQEGLFSYFGLRIYGF